MKKSNPIKKKSNPINNQIIQKIIQNKTKEKKNQEPHIKQSSLLFKEHAKTSILASLIF